MILKVTYGNVDSSTYMHAIIYIVGYEIDVYCNVDMWLLVNILPSYKCTSFYRYEGNSLKICNIKEN